MYPRIHHFMPLTTFAVFLQEGINFTEWPMMDESDFTGRLVGPSLVGRRMSSPEDSCLNIVLKMLKRGFQVSNPVQS